MRLSRQAPYPIAALLLAAAAACGEDDIVGPSDVASIVVTPQAPAVPVGGTRQLTVRVLDAAGRQLRDAEVSFTSRNEAVATVSGTGLISGRSLGDATIDVTSGAVTKTVPVLVATHPNGTTATQVPLDGGPFGVAVSRAGVVLVGRHFVDRLTRFDLPSTTPGVSLTTGRDVVSVAFNPGGTTAYYTNQFSQSVGVVDVATNTTTTTIPIVGDGWKVIVSLDGTKVYATTNTGNVHVIDAATRAVSGSVSLGPPLNGEALHPSDTLLFLSSFVSGELFELNTKTMVSRSVTVGGSPQGLAVDQEGAEIYIANEDGYLDVRSVATGGRLAIVPLGSGGFGLALSPDEAQLWVTLSSLGRVVVIDRASRAIVRTIVVGGTPRRIAFDRFGTTAVVANETGSVHFIR